MCITTTYPGDFTIVQIDPIPDEMWEETGEATPWSRLTGPQLVFMGLPLHLEARAVELDDDGIQQAVEWPEDLDALCTIYPPDGPFMTTTLRGREYIIIAFPHGS